MFKDNALLAQLKQNIQETLPKVEGKVKATDKSYGFLEVDKNKSYFIAPPNMKKVMHGDIIEATISSEKGKEQATPVALITPAVESFVSKISLNQNKFVVTPPPPYKGPALSTQLDKAGKYDQGDYVVARLTGHPLQSQDNANKNQRLNATVESLICKADDNKAPWLVTLAKHNVTGNTLATDAPDEQAQWTLNDCGIKRDNLNDELFFTIDGASTQDMDDAVNISLCDNGNWQLRVAIADPSAYVLPGDATDQQAQARGYTHYLPGQHITMLPESLSHDLCSLREGQQRPALVCTMEVTPRGQLLDNAKFTLAWITSSAKLSYQQVAGFINQQADWEPQPNLATALSQLNQLAFARSVWRAKNTQLFDSQPDYRLQLNDDYAIEHIMMQDQDVARNIVEEAMLCANFSGAALISRHSEYGVYNTHPGFDADKAKKLSLLLSEHGYVYHPEHLLTTEGFCQLQRELTSNNDNYFAARLRKFQLYANISHVAQPHHGLGVAQYATWTSPIRKYGDLQNHRVIKSILHQQYAAPQITLQHVEQLKMQRDNQRMAERDINNWLYMDYLAPALANKTPFKANLFNVNRGGFMAKIIENGVVVFVPSNTLCDDRKHCKVDTELGTISIKDEVVYRLNDAVTVELSELNLARLSINAKVVNPT